MAEPLVVEIIGDLSKLKQQFGTMLPKMPTGGKGGGLGDLSMLTGSLAKLTGVIGILIGAFQASKRLQRAVELLTRPINQLLALLGDLISMVLMPIAVLLKPISRFVRDLRRTMRGKDLFGLFSGFKILEDLGDWLLGEAKKLLGISVDWDVGEWVKTEVGKFITFGSAWNLGEDIKTNVWSWITLGPVWSFGADFKSTIWGWITFGPIWDLGAEIKRRVEEFLGLATPTPPPAEKVAGLPYGTTYGGTKYKPETADVNVNLNLSGGSDLERGLSDAFKENLENVMRIALQGDPRMFTLLKASGMFR